MKLSIKTFISYKEYCSVTIDVTPSMYTKSDKYLKMLIENTHL